MPGDEILAAVLAAASGRCQCGGACGRPHRRLRDGRCETASSPTAPLHAVPRDLAIPPEEAARLPARELMAMCDRCHELALPRAERARRAARPADPGPGLWDGP